ncbi:hypothetical protein MBGDC06_00008 [Thermoplasmatales archaeon SCGC AB-539-C06]|nr:hypothetical protein MBGDC06_00008 [Thermoplasmatales archaeon SCGC AB-539-C06]
MYPFYLELELIKPVVDYFKKQGYVVKREVRIGFCRADIVAFKDNKVTAVELKLNEWKKAIVQAKNYQLGTNYVYLAFPLMKSYNVLRKTEAILEKEGIGLLTVNEETCEVCKIIDAMQSRRTMGTITLEELKRNWKKRSKMKFF